MFFGMRQKQKDYSTLTTGRIEKGWESVNFFADINRDIITIFPYFKAKNSASTNLTLL